MKTDRIKEKTGQNPRKSNSEARISHNSGVGDSPDSPGRREREPKRVTIVIDGAPGVLISEARPPPKYLGY